MVSWRRSALGHLVAAMRFYMAMRMLSLASAKIGCIILICGRARVSAADEVVPQGVDVDVDVDRYLLLFEIDLGEDLVHALDGIDAHVLDLVVEHVHHVLQCARRQVARAQTQLAHRIHRRHPHLRARASSQG